MLENPDSSTLKGFDKFKYAHTVVVVFISFENIVARAENAGVKHFLLLPQRFQKRPFFNRVV